MLNPIPSRWIVSLFATMVGIGAGCNGLKSRYAMSDPVYAEKYAEGAEKRDWIGKTKQSLDARHVAGLYGWSIGGGALYRPKTDHTLGGAEISLENYRQNWLSYRAGFASYASEEESYLGAETSVRAQFPMRVTPFVGVGGMLGMSRTVSQTPLSETLGHGSDGVLYEPVQEHSEVDHFLAAVYPELGVHAWLNGKWRASVSGKYFVTNLGNPYDDWMLGGQLTYFPQRSK